MTNATLPKTVRIFISSPGDVQPERAVARTVIDRLQRQYAGKLQLIPLLWEELPLEATASFQANIDKIVSPEGVDIAVFILWSRLGSPLGPEWRRPDGTPYTSGTAYEFDAMVAASRASGGKPAILAYVKEQPRTLEPLPLEECRRDDLEAKKSEVDELYRQAIATKTFIRENFSDATGTNVGAYHAFRDLRTFENRLGDHLQKKLDDLLPNSAYLPARHWEGSPFRGLQVFDVEHESIYFGRETAIDQVQQTLFIQSQKGRTFVLVVGPSGIGKSSLVRAGVMPAVMHSGAVERIGSWRRAILVPGGTAQSLFHELAAALTADDALPELLHSGMGLEELAKALRENPQRAVMAIGAALTRVAEPSNGPTSSGLVLLVDQLEAMFAGESVRPEERKRFIAALTALADSGSVWVLATLRSDFYDRVHQLPELVQLKEGGQVDLVPPTPAEFGQMINKPAATAGLRYERDPATGQTLDECILDDAVRSPEALPLLEYTLDELYKLKTPDGVLTFQAYRDLGGVEGALTRRADRIYESLPRRSREVLPRVLNQLVAIGDDNTGRVVRRLVPLDRVARTPEEAAVVDKFTEERLLVTSRHNGRAVVSVAHEALLRNWKVAEESIAASKEFLESRARLHVTAHHLEEERRRGDLLLPEGRLLAEAEDLLLCHESELDPEDIAYTRASVTRNNRRRLYIWLLLCLFIIVPALLLLGRDLASVDSARAMYNKTLSLDFTKLDIISGSILGIPAAIVPLWVTYRKWRGRPEFETIYLDKAFWATNCTVYLLAIICMIIVIRCKVATFPMWGFVVTYTVWVMVLAAQWWKKARLLRYYRRRREGLCTLEIVRRRLSRMSKAGLAVAMFVIAGVVLFLSPAIVSNLATRQYVLELWEAHQKIAQYQVRDGQFEHAQDSLKRASGLNSLELLAPRSDAEVRTLNRREVETLAGMGVVLRLAGKPQEAEQKFRKALETIRRPGREFMPGNKVTSLDVVGRTYFVEPPGYCGGHFEHLRFHLEQASEYFMRLPLLILASQTGAAPTVVQILGDGTDVETRAEDGSTALIMAALNGHAQVIETLLKRGAKVDAMDQAGFSALIMAAGAGHADVVKQLIASGADVGAWTQDGVTALMAAAFQGRGQVVETLLRHGAKVNATDRAGGTALMAAAGAGHADVVKQFLTAGSDRWLRRWNGETAATLASNRGHKNVLASLFDVESFNIELMPEKAIEPGGKDAARLADVLVCAGDLARRSGDFKKAVSLFRQALEALPEREDTTPQRLPVLVRFSSAKAAAKEYDVAVQYMERAIAVSEVLAQRYPESALVCQEIASLYGRLAFRELLCKRPQRTIAAARTALELDASQVGLKAMLAHGLLLAGQFEEAKNLYLENRSVRLGDEQSFASLVLRDFGQLRDTGISHPDMGRIEELLRTGNGARDVK